MDGDGLKTLLDGLLAGTISRDEAERRLRTAPLEEAGGFATVDLHRSLRCGTPEVIFGQGKTAEQTIAILQTLNRHDQGGLVTRVPPGSETALLEAFPEGEWNALGRTFRVRAAGAEAPKVGRVVVVTAGTSDLPVAEEARVSAESWGCEVTLVVDVGVAGIHRLFRRLDDLGGADCVVVVAGMEGALPSVVGGLVACPVIAVPTSIGYGASFGGLAALLGMLNSCASNVVVVNIDAGFNGGHVGGLIARRAGLARAGAKPDQDERREHGDSAH